MHYDEIVQLQEQHASWALLRSRHAAVMLSFFGRVFVESNSGGRSLRDRRTNIPAHSLQLRAQLCRELRRTPEELPFAGELIQVAEAHQTWEGAAERVLRGFGLSLLVPNDAYDAVRRWVDDHHLGGKLVYFRVPERLAPRAPVSRGPGLFLVDCLEVQHGNRYGPWLHAELERRAAYACLDDVADFRSAVRAVTRAGQIKDTDRHEKLARSSSNEFSDRFDT
jgi:uncharacterized protein YPO0396